MTMKMKDGDFCYLTSVDKATPTLDSNLRLLQIQEKSKSADQNVCDFTVCNVFMCREHARYKGLVDEIENAYAP